MTSRPFFHTSLLLFLTTLFCLSTATPGKQLHKVAAGAGTDEALHREIIANIHNGCFLLERETNTPLSYNGQQQFIPASIWKITTAASALFYLGKGYRFQTEFYQDETGNVYVKGFGDPFLVSEEIDRIVEKLEEKLIRPIHTIYIDQSVFALGADVPVWQSSSDNPYDARNYATSVNFNTINITVSESGTTSSAESQTPSLAIMARMTRHLAPGTHRINISQDRENVNRYTGELFQAKTPPEAFGDHRPQGLEKAVPPDATRIYRHYSSKALPEIIRAMFLYSNNFIANQLFLTSGAVRFGYPATWQKAREAQRIFLADTLGLDENEFHIIEGSGLARANKVSGRAMLQIVDHFRRFATLLPRKKGVLIKSGTLNGVYSYAGYLTDNHGRHPFVIMLNQPANTRDTILNILQKR